MDRGVPQWIGVDVNGLEGVDWGGLEQIGLEWIGVDWSGLQWIGMHLSA